MQSIPPKLAFLLFCWSVAFAAPVSVQALVLAVIAFGPVLRSLRPVSPSARRIYARFLASALCFASLIVALNALFLREGAVLLSLGPLEFHHSGILFGVRVAVRLLLLMTSVLVVAVSTPIRAFASYLERTSLPAVVPAVLLLALDLLDRIPQRISMIFNAQEARGARVRAGLAARTRSLVAIAGPLLISSIVESIDRSHALAARGFLGERRQKARPDEPPDRVFWVLLAASMLTLLWGLWRLLYP